MINWKVRAKNPNFWMALIPAVILVVQAIAAAAGVQLELEGVQQTLVNLCNAVFSLLAVLGIVNDPTTAGFSDSFQAMEYRVPKEKESGPLNN